MRLRLLLPALLLALALPALGQPTTYFHPLFSPDPEPGSRFGSAIALGGDFVVVGEPGAEDASGSEGPLGRALVYLRDPGEDVWSLQQELEPNSIETGGEFAPAYGSDVAVEGLYALVGAPYESEEALNSGAAFLFRYDEELSTWVQFDKFKAPEPVLEDQFGYAVAISGEVAVVGAYAADEAAENAGAAYVFLQDTEGGAWNYFQTLTADDAAPGDHFGFDVAVFGPTIIVGRDGADTEPGAAYVFEFQTSDTDSTWVQTQKLQASDGEAGDEFGFAVGASLDALIVGAPHVGSEEGGAAYVFERDGAEGWVESARLAAEPPVLNSSFGSAVSVQEGLAVVGVPRTVADEAGAVYVFTRDEGWAFSERLEAPTPETASAFGETVVANADVLAIGSPQQDGDVEAAGAVYLYGVAGTAAEGAAEPSALRLDSPYPNPIATHATIPYVLDEAAPVELAVYDVLGREVAVLERGPRAAGSHTARWAASDLPAGLYIVQLRAGDASATRKVLVVR